ncbi:hypothetical protein AB1283_25940 [Bacillus sp. S13(2024)]|uniref:hypothetical protein n=1 Tax=Bacillus sp. S13(2024) TaxID=3162885 RepID=UPI003D24BD00
MDKFKNKGLWVALFALGALIGKDFFVNFNIDNYNAYVDGIMAVLIALGVISNPSSGTWFKDQGQKEEK